MQKKILILGGTGMMGHVLFIQYLGRDDLDVYVTVRSAESVEKRLPLEYMKRLQVGVDAHNFDNIVRVIANVNPDVIINCVGIIKPLTISNNLLAAISINALLPHRISLLCQVAGIRLIHISTDGVFDGQKGGYTENDDVSISDEYGMTKRLGELSGPNNLTIRTSIIGHELKGKEGLVEWFLSRNEKVLGYTRAIYSGFPTVELARIISDYVIPNDNLTGIYHVSSDSISKYELLRLIADRYEKKIKIEPSDEVVVDRSLDSTAFRSLTGYTPPSWPEMINKMYLNYLQNKGSIYV
jgi:dTDP-4-dehydrorhamnose reductase